MKFNKIALFTVCFINCFSIKTLDTLSKEDKAQHLSWHAEHAANESVYDHALDNYCRELTGIEFKNLNLELTVAESRFPRCNVLNEIISNNIRSFRQPSTPMKPGESSSLKDKDNPTIYFHKPTLKERAVIVQVLKTRSNILENYEEIADLVNIVDSGLPKKIEGFYFPKLDKIYLQKSSLSKPHELLHNIAHEYQHYKYYIGHAICTLAKKRSIDRELEEYRAEQGAAEIVNCSGCAEKIISERLKNAPIIKYILKNFTSKNNSLKNHLRQSLLQRHFEPYISFDIYTDPEKLAEMSPSCQLCSPELVQQDYQKEILALFHP